MSAGARADSLRVELPAARARRAGLRRDLFLLASFAACVVLPGLGARDLWNPDEPRYGQVAREMAESGEYLVPHLNGRLYTQKPPLMFWAINASALLSGELDERAVRLPSAMAAIGTVLLVYMLGRRLFDRRTGWIAAAIFLTSFKVLLQSRVGQIDMLLTFLVTCAVWWWVKGRLEGRPALSTLFFAFAGLATLAKGPVGLLPPLLSILAFLALERDREGLRDLRLGRGLSLWAALVLAWLAPAIAAAGSGYAREMLFGQNLGRYLAPAAHLRPPWYFLGVVPVDFLPWSLFVPSALAGARVFEGARRRWALFLLCWVVVTVLFFSLSPGKRTVYVLTMYPALALLTGAGLAALSRSAQRTRVWLAAPAAAAGLLVAVVAAAAALGTSVAEVPEFAVPLLPAVGAGAAVVAAAMALAAVLGWRARVSAMVGTIAGALGAGAVALTVSVAPRLDPEMSLRPLAERLARERPASHALLSIEEMEGGLLFYGSGFARELWSEEELRAALARGEPAWLVVDPDVADRLRPPSGLVLVARQGEREDGVRVLAMPPPSEGR